MVRAPAICVSHGGGPMPVLNDPGHLDIVSSLKNRVPKILKLGTPDAPRAIIVVTAHWSTRHPTVSSGAKHSLYYDYGGFPPEAYKLKYDAPGSPEVAEQVKAALGNAGFKTVLDSQRGNQCPSCFQHKSSHQVPCTDFEGGKGWDHGVFIPFLLINPAADIPVIQMSVLDSEDPREHFKMGQALSALRDDNIAIVGSGFASFHNLRIMFSLRHQDEQTAAQFKASVDRWNQSVTDAVSKDGIEEKEEALSRWRDIDGSYVMHPRGGAEHFLPLIVVAGAARGDEKLGKYSDEFVGLDMWTYYWGDVAV
ncbi:Extradiol ring-cleavage dioxygenase, class III enzyme, subunit B [Microdochium trichocladiopsis]|uniref:Extradiol ring-cleavage dioxygenase, class III enzyme, subunit B n=1 Tax=Microdochium trichocladiopsis TaxID=1682393 RepID=A0A9P8XZX3_9PEZI|nr:Extradiol ring-cleavage dioxygenase, class III enzyme, subunit B [Microdochium trichocladiopsis]KAH7027223.1 Extradiol ring-cleavage dioxygenase, class III enzyme, subunit B [Microdochium trichocladiopsis]